MHAIQLFNPPTHHPYTVIHNAVLAEPRKLIGCDKAIMPRDANSIFRPYSLLLNRISLSNRIPTMLTVVDALANDAP
jgi:hypothetical protein